ncbi:MAG: FAD-dependent oxidoreductase [Robiginitomaculum sp.]|nr:MAG: FAD-dependent oxidoreductase [Robiginitomaculum sp.]
MGTKNYDVVIVGAGHNGLVCAFYLARKGLKVCMLERSAIVGGAAITEEFYRNDDGGFRNSVASYTVSLLQPKIIEDMELHRHGLTVVLREVNNFLPLEDGYILGGRKGLTLREIKRHSAKDALAYGAYEKTLDGVVKYFKEMLLVVPPNTGGGIADLYALMKTGNRLRNAPLETKRNILDFFTKSAKDILDQYFENDAVKALFGFDGVVGHFASPEEPGSAYVLLHHVFGEACGESGAWGHAMGGMGAITQAMKSACEEKGVDIFTQMSVEKICIEKGRAVGVQTADTLFKAPIISSNVHQKILYENLIEPDVLPTNFRARIKNYKSHSGTFRMNVALDGLPNFLNAPKDEPYLTGGIIIAPSLAYMDEAWMSARTKGWSDKPIIEILIPSLVDDSLAPKGRHVASLFCQQFSYDLPNGMTWDGEREGVADHILDTVEKYAPGFKTLVLGRQILSPLDLERKFGLVRGDIFHGVMSVDQLYSARPVLGHGSYRSPIKGLYMCGSGTHPGGGVTGAPGHNAAHAILQDRKRYI